MSVIDPSKNNSVTNIPLQTPRPNLIAFDSGSGEVYVTAFNCANCDGTLSVIDPTANTVIATVQLGRVPSPVAVDPSTHNVYAGNVADGTISVVSPSQGYTVTNTILTGASTEPFALALDSSGKVYAALETTNQVAVINPAQGYSVTKIAVGNSPTIVTYDSGVNLVAVLNEGSNTVSYISPTSLSITATVAVGSQSVYANAMISNGSFKGTAVVNATSDSVSLIED